MVALHNRDAKPSLNNSCGYSRFLLGMVPSGVAHFCLSHIYIKFVKLWMARQQSRKKEAVNSANLIKMQKALQTFIFCIWYFTVFLAILPGPTDLFILLFYTPENPKQLNHTEIMELPLCEAICKYSNGQLSFSQGISSKKTSVRQRRFSCEESYGLVWWFFSFCEVQNFAEF